ncbi:vitamin B12-dependent ribonucleotide reductase [Andreesenia angusta]|uniref:Vitamin B12-dependent ribonucleotide reductase n=1 Tax=Andreesenia angusta TaxID=39480 RepID=A0A1S1V6Z2_9FIRM|nr:vitamin B12-dependent ribonucleotide reductase [Andreesenia angusta]OHW62371.1 vitamin B12-dependent ribonucleotide reductase [Andreesenia angusta]
MKLENEIKRVYTQKLEEPKYRGKSVYDLFKYKTVDVVMQDYKTGKTTVDMKNLEFPEFYSQNACDIIASKYFRKQGVTNKYGYERSMKEVVHRLTSFWTEAAYNEGILDEDNKQIFYDEVAYMIMDQRFSPNSPQWFNTGLKHSYGIEKESDGHYYYDEKTGRVEASKDAYTRTQGSACFIVSIADSLLGDKSITEQIVTETRLFKHGSGTGTNFSEIRGVGEKLSGGGTSSGLMSFLKVFDRNAGAIKSGGTTRRAAKIVCLDVDHPEIEDFIDWKVKEEKKVMALGKMGYDMDFNGEAYETVSGQNSNNSVRFTDEFMRKALGEEDSSWELKGRVDSRINKSVDASKLWDKFNYASWFCADPAPQFHDIINDWNTCKVEDIEASNPCSEYHFLKDTACNLLSHNVVKYYNPETGEFDTENFKHAVSLAQVILEATIHWGHFPTADIAERSHLYRTTGQGVANLGALHMMMAHPYDSDEARNIGASIVGLLTGQAYRMSSLMAEKVGSFPEYPRNRESMLRVIRNHARVVDAIDGDFELGYTPLKVDHSVLEKEGLESLSECLKSVWRETYEYGEKYGYRNAQVTVIAPTGTIALAMDCATTGPEPFFAHVVYKKLVGGGFMEIVNPHISIALKKLGYTNSQIRDIEDYILKKEKVTENGYSYEKIKDGKIEGAPHLKPEHLTVFDTANKCGTGARYIEPMAHVKYIAQITPLVSGAISKTVNLPNSATIEEFKEVHSQAWKMGVKCIALYRDGSKASQPLNSSKRDEKKKLEELSYWELLELVKKLKEKEESEKPHFRSEVENYRLDEKEGFKKVECSSCGSISMVPNGTCHICLECGSTTGCS